MLLSEIAFTPPRFLIIGAGAIGSLVGGRLAQVGADVTLVGRPAYVAAVRAHGLQLTNPDGQTTVVSAVRAVSSVAKAFTDPTGYDLALLTVKGYDTAGVIRELQDAVAAPPPILTLQNGAGNEERLAEAFGPQQVLAGVITAPVEVPEPGRIVVTKRGQIGLAPVAPAFEPTGRDDSIHHQLSHVPDAVSALLEGTSSWLEKAGFQVCLYRDYRALKWTKLLLNMLANATCAILGWPPERVFADQRLAALEIGAWREALAVMRAVNIRLLPLGGYPLPWVAPLVRWLPTALLQPLLRKAISGGRGGKMPSLYLDLERGRGKSEVVYLNGAIVKAGERYGVPVPINRSLTAVLLNIVQGRVPWDEFRGRPERLLRAVGK
ncbi:MAG TPA: ketopantoate reductase family protein [Anaerolineae bacterium]|nr:ketopantoate reductase family protein [Anaerolineae bacterium]HIQ04577.1 ketopantoate reductase family protein [Anaerolineae bacterium]